MNAGIRFGVLRSYLNRHWAAVFSIALFLIVGPRLPVILQAQPRSPRENRSPNHYSCISPRLKSIEDDGTNYAWMVCNTLANYHVFCETIIISPPLFLIRSAGDIPVLIFRIGCGI